MISSKFAERTSFFADPSLDRDSISTGTFLGAIQKAALLASDNWLSVEDRLRESNDEMIAAIASWRPLADVMDILCRCVEAIASDAVCSVVSVDALGRLHPLAAPSLPQDFARSVEGLKAGPRAGSCGTAAYRGTPVEVVDIASDPLWADFKHLALPLGLRASWSSPILAHDGRVIGVIGLNFRVPRGPNERERRVVASCLSLCAIAIERWEARERVNKLAFTDALTGLGNRTKLTEKLPVTISRARDANEQVALLYVDLDDFKAVNDLHGHTMGDVLLAQVATRLKAITSGADMVVRWGGDQFQVIHKTARGAPAIGHLAQQIANGLRGRYELDTGLTVSITASVGVSRFPDDGADLDELVARADTALQFAKSRRRGRCATFEPFMEREQTARRSFEKDVAQAVERKEISVVYQPQANAQSGSIEGFEALVRWRHPTRGLVPPSEFIPAAEACGAIAEIGACALKTACREAASWKAPLRVAVNVSPAQIVNADFSRVVEETLRDTWLDPKRLEVEVTESLFIRDGDAALATLQRLKSLGVGVAIDDFGTGYSSLSTLRSFPFDRLKIDRSFVSDMMSNAAASAIVVSVLGLGHAMGLLVVAEGVETRSQFEVLRSLGCDIVQGHLIGKPLAIEAYKELTSGRVTRFSAGDSDGVPSGPMSP